MSYISLGCAILGTLGDDEEGDDGDHAGLVVGSVCMCGVARKLGEWVASCAAGW
jgi:hypothetical protein